MPDMAVSVTLGGRQCLQPDAYPAARGVANRYRCPVGFDPGVAHAVMLRSEFAQLDAAQPLQMVFTGGGTISLAGLYVRRASQISAREGETGYAGDPNAAMLIELLDVRHVGRWSSINRQYNVRMPAAPYSGSEPSRYYAQSLNSGALWTWATMWADLWAQLPGVFGSAPALPYTPDGTPEGFRFIGCSTWNDALRIICDRLQLLMIYDPQAGQFSVQQQGAAQPDAQQAEALYSSYEADDGVIVSAATQVPATVRVFFPIVYQNYGSEPTTGRATNTSLTPAYSVDVATGVSGAGPGVVPLWDDLSAISAFGGSISNTSALNSRAAERAAGWVAHARAEGSTRRYTGALPFRPGSQNKTITWRNYGPMQPAGGCCTEVSKWRARPLSPDGSAGPITSTPAAAPGAERLAAPDHGRATLPLFPPLLQIVQVAGSGSAGDPQSPDGANLIDGMVIRVDATQSTLSGACYVQDEACWILVTNPVGSAPALPKGNYYLARLSGAAASSGGTTRPLYVIDSSQAVGQVVRFKTTTTLSLGGTATAKLQNWDGAAYVDGSTITVVDWFGASGIGDVGEWQAPSGYYGFAVKLTDKSEYQILYMEHQAEFIKFTLTSDVSAGSAGAAFNSFWMGRNTGSETTVYDRTGQWATCQTGDEGIACWDSKLGQYVIIVCGALAKELYLFDLNEDLILGSSADATIRLWIGAVWDTRGADVTVWDSTLLGPGKTSQIGIAFLSSQSGRFEIVALNNIRWPQIVRFRLTEYLSLGSSATAQIQQWDPTGGGGGGAYIDGSSITVVDYYGSLGRRGAWQAPSGYYGYAVAIPDRADQYQILTMEKVAVFTTATLTESMGHTTPGQALANFSGGNFFWQGQDTAGATKVYDPIGIWSSLASGARVVCSWDDAQQRYQIIDGQQAGSQTYWARAYAGHTLDTHSKSINHYVECQDVSDSTGAGYDGGSEHFNVYLPSPDSATDPNVEAGTIIGYVIDSGGRRVCTTGYLDDARGMLKIWSGAEADIPHGWQLCDGSNDTPDLRGKFILGAQPGGSGSPFDDAGNGNDVGESGGLLKHTHAAHAPAATSAVGLVAASTAEASTDSEFVGKPMVIDTTPNMTGSPIASGTVVPTVLTAVSILPNLTVDPTTLSDGHSHTIGLTAVDIKEGSGIYSYFLNAAGPVASTDSASGWLGPNPHSHGVTESGDDVGTYVFPNPHTHAAVLPVTGITFSPSSTPATPAGTVISDTAVEVATTISPASHYHMTPTLAHDYKYHTPPYFALCYIMRTV